MKLKHLLLTLALFVGLSSLFAEKVEMKEAGEVATTFVNAKFQLNNPGSTHQFVISESFPINNGKETVMYVFNFSNGGYAVVPADDRIYPVVGFSFDNEYNPEYTPDNCDYVIRNFGDQVTHVRTNNVDASDAASNAWANLRSSKSEKLSFLTNSRDLDPMLTSTLDQGWPYNGLCPEDVNGPGGHVYAGCVATTMAMIMYHYRYPKQGTGSHSYMHPVYGFQQENFGEHTYDWSAMLNSTSAFNYEMAEIQRDCGVAVEMDYSWEGSGAYSTDVVPAIKSYFGYSNTATYYARTGWSAWKLYLEQQLVDLNQPVYYSGQSPEGGHAFCVDGLQEQSDDTYYHFNFGWGGYSNGWYLATDAGGFNSSNAMIRNFIPDENNYPYSPPEELEILTHMQGTIEDCSGPNHNYEANITSSWLISPQTEFDSVSYIKVTFDRFETESVNDVVRLYDGNSESAPLLGEFSGNEIPGVITSEGNEILITFTTNQTIEANGWMLSYKCYFPTFCSGTQSYTEPSGTFDDGSGSFYYNNGQTCMWTIKPDYASSTTIYFNYFETEEGEDKLKVYDLESQELLADLSGNEVPEPITSQSGSFYFVFSTNSTVKGYGWEIYYEADNVGVAENETVFGDFKLFPNPASQNINLSFVSPQAKQVNVSLYTITGVNVYSSELANASGVYFNSIDVSKISKGVYFLNIKSDEGTLTRKVIID